MAGTLDDATLAALFKRVKTIAVVGFSDKPHRPSHGVARFLQEQGYELYPVNPHLAGRQLLGRPVYADLASVPVPIDMVDVFRHPDFLPEVVRDAIGVGAGLVWTQLGVISPSAEQLAEEGGMPMIVDRCPAIEIPRLQAAGLLPRPA